MNTKERMKRNEWGGVVQTTMTIHDVPFKHNPQEVIPTEYELKKMRNGFDDWMKRQGSLL